MLIINADDCGGRDSVMAQTWLPERWEIVDGDSTDRIAKIVPGYTDRSPWIELIQRSFHRPEVQDGG